MPLTFTIIAHSCHCLQGLNCIDGQTGVKTPLICNTMWIALVCPFVQVHDNRGMNEV